MVLFSKKVLAMPVTCRTIVLQSGVKPASPASEEWTLHCRTTREVLENVINSYFC